jgi:hypothetical protein
LNIALEEISGKRTSSRTSKKCLITKLELSLLSLSRSRKASVTDREESLRSEEGRLEK